MSQSDPENTSKSRDEDGISTAAIGPGTPTPGDQIGPYKLLEILGEGGFATVFLSEQQKPVRRQVALKIIKPGMDSKQVIARFEVERQALALLDHPNVAHIYDVGTTDIGRPYLAMEYVKGVPVTEHCDREKLNIEERLKLFLQVCEAIQHAHQKGIIHRDIKPSNILVSFEGERALPKVIDFGIAKAISQPLTDRTLHTVQGQLMGTPEYMSPEQAEMTTQDIDTRSDIYSLGVVLYELLAGVLPFESDALRRGGLDHLRQVIREQDPRAPSTRLSQLTREDCTRIAQQRRTDAGVLRRKLRGDLDWITLKAMHKDRTHRYGSTGELAADIRRHLNNEPVVAGPPSTLYRMRKCIHRHQALATGLVAVLVVLLAGIAGVALLAVKADRQAHTAHAVRDFLIDDLLGSLAPEQLKSPAIRVHSMLDNASQRLEGRFADQPLEEARIRQALGEMYVKLGDYRAAEVQFKRACDVRGKRLGDKDPSTLTSMSHLGRSYFLQRRYQEAEPLLIQVLEARRRVLGPEDADTLEAMASVGLLYLYQAAYGRTDEIEKLLTAAFKTGKDRLGSDHRITLEAMYGLAFLEGTLANRPDEAVPLCLEGLKTAQGALGEEDTLTLKFMALAALFEAAAGQYKEAELHARTAMEKHKLVLGPEHPDTLFAMGVLGRVYTRQNEFEQAEPLLADSVRLGRSVLGREHPLVLDFMVVLGRVDMMLGRYSEAELLLRDVGADVSRVPGDDHADAVNSAVRMMSALYAMQERADKLKAWCSTELEKLQQTHGKGRSLMAVILNQVAWRQAAYPSAAIRDGAEAIRNATRACELSSWNNAQYIDTLAAAYAEAGDFVGALREQNKAIESLARQGDIFSATPEALRYPLTLYESRQTIREGLLSVGARSAIANGKYNRAEQELTTALAMGRRYLGETHPETRGCILAFIELYEAWGKPEKAEEWRAKLP